MNANNLGKEAYDGTQKLINKFIFLAEDDLDDQELLSDAINFLDTDTTIHTITNGQKAVAYLESLEDAALPQLIVLDYNLPELNGEEILQILSQKSRYHAIPKIVWSTSNSNLYKTKCLQLGATAYMVKPTDFSGIENLAKQMLELCAAIER